MAQAVRRADSYDAVIDNLLTIAKRQVGWNSYDADPALPSAMVGAIGLVHRFRNLTGAVPVPEVGALADGAVVLRWLTEDREVEIVYRGPESGEYSVLRRGASGVVEEGFLRQVDPLKDIVDAHVLGRHRLRY